MDTKSNNYVFLRACFLTLSGSFLYALSNGIRNNYGIMLNSIIGYTGISLTSVSLIFAVGQFVFGLVQPVFGIIAAKKGSKLALVSGVFITAAGLILTPFSKSMFSLRNCKKITCYTFGEIL